MRRSEAHTPAHTLAESVQSPSSWAGAQGAAAAAAAARVARGAAAAGCRVLVFCFYLAGERGEADGCDDVAREQASMPPQLSALVQVLPPPQH